jgi:hypothetical protein
VYAECLGVFGADDDGDNCLELTVEYHDQFLYTNLRHLS